MHSDIVLHCNSPMDRDDVLNLRVPASLKDALKSAAKDDRRTMSALAQIVLSDWLTARGYLKAIKNSRKGRGH